VGGLDFRLTNEELKQHFITFGEIESAVILKDINTGLSRGFGFVTFKEEVVAQDLIKNVQITEINGRKVDIKSAEPKQSNSNQPAPVIPRRNPAGAYAGGPPGVGQESGQFAVIPQYGGDNYRKGREFKDRSESPPQNYKEREFRKRDEYRERVDYHKDSRRDERRRPEQHHKRRYRSPDSHDSRESSYSRNRDYRRRGHDNRDRRGPHHGGSSHHKDQAGRSRDRRSRS